MLALPALRIQKTASLIQISVSAAAYVPGACPSGAISMMPKELPPQQPKTDKVVEALRALVQSKAQAENIASQLPDTLSKAVAKSCRLMAEDLCREAGFMLPQSANTKEFLEQIKSRAF